MRDVIDIPRFLLAFLATIAMLLVPSFAQAAPPSHSASQVARSTSPAQASQPVGTTATGTTGSSNTSAAAYWTRDRLLKAKSKDMPSVTRAQAKRLSQTRVPSGPAESVAPTRAQSAVPSATPVQTDVSDGSSWPSTASQTPTRTTGKVFFQDDAGGYFQCAGSVVTSESKLVVFTAGHCVFDQVTKHYYKNWMYIPAYKAGTAPYGIWTARELWTTDGWKNGEWPSAIPYDTGAAVLNLNAGRRLTDVTGANGIAFNQDAAQYVYAFAYPAEAPFDGTTLKYCTGTTALDPNFGSRELACTMNGGSSGGPWIKSFVSGTGLGLLNGQASYTYSDDTTHLYSPYYGGPQSDLYQVVRGRYVSHTKPADFTGDGKTDVTVYRPSTGVWWVNGLPAVRYGVSTDIPVPGDYNGDGKADRAVWRPSTAVWWINGISVGQFGLPGDIPVPGDYNSDGITDRAVFRPSIGVWWQDSSTPVQLGQDGDIPIPADYNGDGSTDPAVYRPSTHQWLINGQPTVTWGVQGDVPVAGDYNGDGKADIAIWRPSTGQWFVRGLGTVAWGSRGDVPLVGDYNGDGKTDYAVWRPSSYVFYVRSISTTTYGAKGDKPLPRPVGAR
jgi:V8-like Glu-specific endopeptidase